MGANMVSPSINTREKMKSIPVDLDSVLGSLKDFQRRTAVFAFEKLFLDTNSPRRFLVADEVGLGKTLVARGIVALAIDHLWEHVKRIDIVYVCSNKDIARQNIERLRVTKDEGFTLATRLTLLARHRKVSNGDDFRNNSLNFISLTPGTSFDQQGTQLGEKSERVLLYHLLTQCWGVSGMAAQNVFQGNAGVESFRNDVAMFHDQYELAPDVLKLFVAELKEAQRKCKLTDGINLRERFEDLCKRFPRTRDAVPLNDRIDRNVFVGEMRRILAKACVKVLSPDLVILDEFQRFRHLLSNDSEAGELAHDLFNFVDEESKAHVLLLSATPYKMYTISAEAAEDNHYEDFLRTLKFLLKSDEEANRIAALLSSFRQELLRGGGQGSTLLNKLKISIQNALQRVIARTERLAVNLDRNGMLVEKESSGELTSDDLRGYCDIQRIARLIDAPDMLEYWKSAPYLLNFMDEYQFKNSVVTALSDSDTGPKLHQILANSPRLLLSKAVIEGGKEIPPGNSRLRGLIGGMTRNGAWQLLWIPPSNPYYKLDSVYALPSLKGMTKRLVFSSWRVVPKVIASLVSHDAECLAKKAYRKTTGKKAPGGVEGSQSQLLRFAIDRERRFTGMPIFSLIYPSVFLARQCDPHAIAGKLRSQAMGLPSKTAVRKVIEQILRTALAPHLASSPTKGQKDEAWYWAAPLLLDIDHYCDEALMWFAQDQLASKWAGEQIEDERWAEHVDKLRQFAKQPEVLGPPPSDLFQVLAGIAMGGPANCALRSLARTLKNHSSPYPQELRNASARIGWSFRGHFNRPHVITILRGIIKGESYWQSVLDYSASGCLQAVLDEYIHVLKESLGLIQTDDFKAAERIAEAVGSALSLRPSNLKVDYFEPSADSSRVELESGRITARYALPLVEAQEEIDQDASRVEKVRESFNSPFWPFVVASTSIGQEGLDFHTYCHAIVHWNLPSNPVDMEQREGRVHRYKGHAVRKNLASVYGAEFSGEGMDPWSHIFDRSVNDRDISQNDLIPYWVYPLENGAKIERHVFAPPLSRDKERLEAIRRTMAIYRLVIGQPRQDDLVQYLIEQNSGVTEGDLENLSAELSIDLAPPSSHS